MRLEAERRLKALEAELVKAETQQRERKLMGRYHKVKFFERRKLERRIGKAKRVLKEEGSDKEEKKVAQKELWRDRVLLNYVLVRTRLLTDCLPNANQPICSTALPTIREVRLTAPLLGRSRCDR